MSDRKFETLILSSVSVVGDFASRFFLLPSKSVNECKQRAKKSTTFSIYIWSFELVVCFLIVLCIWNVCEKNTTEKKNTHTISISFSLIHLYSFRMIYFLNARLNFVIDIQSLAQPTTTNATKNVESTWCLEQEREMRRCESQQKKHIHTHTHSPTNSFGVLALERNIASRCVFCTIENGKANEKVENVIPCSPTTDYLNLAKQIVCRLHKLCCDSCAARISQICSKHSNTICCYSLSTWLQSKILVLGHIAAKNNYIISCKNKHQQYSFPARSRHSPGDIVWNSICTESYDSNSIGKCRRF